MMCDEKASPTRPREGGEEEEETIHTSLSYVLPCGTTLSFFGNLLPTPHPIARPNNWEMGEGLYDIKAP